MLFECHSLKKHVQKLEVSQKCLHLATWPGLRLETALGRPQIKSTTDLKVKALPPPILQGEGNGAVKLKV